MLEKSKLFSELCESTSDIKDPNQINRYRLFCYGFRSGGFVDATKIAIQAIKSDEKTREYLSEADSWLGEMLGLRVEAVPSDYFVARRFHHYVGSVNAVLENLERAAQEADTEKQEIEIRTIYRNFEKAMERVTKSDGLYVLNCNDEFLLDHGAIDLPDQGLKIVQMIFTNDLGLHFATVSPGSSFYHSHGDLSELHFVREKCPYEHFVGGKRFQVREADVVAMAPGVPHGGRNISDKEYVKLYFIAGDRTYGPWRADFSDRTNHPIGNLEEATDIEELNGALLESTIKGILSSRGYFDGTVISPSQCAGKTGYGIGLEALHVRHEGIAIQDSSSDHIIKVWDGEGYITIDEVKGSLRLKPQDCLSIPEGIEYKIKSDKRMVLLRFGLYQHEVKN